jgi:hypothetical protein
LNTDDQSPRRAIASAKALFADKRMPIAVVAALVVGALGSAVNAWLTTIPDKPQVVSCLGYALGVTLIIAIAYFLRRRR